MGTLPGATTIGAGTVTSDSLSVRVVDLDFVRFDFSPVMAMVGSKSEDAVPVFDPRAEDYHLFVDRTAKRPR